MIEEGIYRIRPRGERRRYGRVAIYRKKALTEADKAKTWNYHLPEAHENWRSTSEAINVILFRGNLHALIYRQEET
ncbi:MAG: hypothetical protein JWM16_1318 [Verrucomicrobiales bacterium]|nr:hypothetical protein [Verrucomicrobiales bacterium]